MLLIIILSYRWNHNKIPILFKIVKEFIFHSQQGPHRPPDCLSHHGSKDQQLSIPCDLGIRGLSPIRPDCPPTNLQKGEEPPETKTGVQDHTEIIESGCVLDLVTENLVVLLRTTEEAPIPMEVPVQAEKGCNQLRDHKGIPLLINSLTAPKQNRNR